MSLFQFAVFYQGNLEIAAGEIGEGAGEDLDRSLQIGHLDLAVARCHGPLRVRAVAGLARLPLVLLPFEDGFAEAFARTRDHADVVAATFANENDGRRPVGEFTDLRGEPAERSGNVARQENGGGEGGEKGNAAADSERPKGMLLAGCFRLGQFERFDLQDAQRFGLCVAKFLLHIAAARRHGDVESLRPCLGIVAQLDDAVADLGAPFVGGGFHPAQRAQGFEHAFACLGGRDRLFYFVVEFGGCGEIQLLVALDARQQIAPHRLAHVEMSRDGAQRLKFLHMHRGRVFGRLSPIAHDAEDHDGGDGAARQRDREGERELARNG